MTRGISFGLVGLISATCVYFVVGLLLSEDISVDMVISKAGTASSAQCYKTRSSLGVKFRIDYGDGNGVIDDVFLFSLSPVCDESMLRLFAGKSVEVFFHKNVYLGIVADGETLLSVEEGVSQFNRKGTDIVFIVALAIIFITAILMASRHSTK